LITIAGSGVSGSYLALLLKNGGFDVTAYDPRREYYYIPCGYATNYYLIRDMLRRVNVEFDDFLLSMGKTVTFSREDGKSFHFRCRGLCTYDKNALSDHMNSMVGTVRAKPPKKNPETMVDCTGISRYYLGPLPNDFRMRTKEFLTAAADHRDFYFRYFRNGRGYYWEFPLGESFHIGAGSDSLEILEESLRGISGSRVTGRDIRLRFAIDGISNGKVIGCGESIGTVSPVTGEGILPSMECADLLYRAITSSSDMEGVLERYRNALAEKFRRFVLLFELLQKARSGSLVQLRNFRYLWPALEDLRHFGIDISAPKLIAALIR